MKKFIQYDEALSWAKDEAEAIARKGAEDRESGNVSVIVDVREKSAQYRTGYCARTR